ncbi:MAG: hypothetical protein JSU70_17650 [Phycisphaerales bacterium]|nr:MAG: hypothetical protein JSU70_17650 [Phycisphaerales bacterium]
MNLDLRKCLVGLISLAALLVVFLLYGRMSKTPQIKIDTGGEFVDAVAGSNVTDFEGEVGKIGDVGVAALRKPEFLHRNKEGEIDRRFGFDELLHQEGDIWRIKSPYMDIFMPDFKCYITAGSGKVQVETAAGRHTPKDATFSGNVVIHIVPEKGSNIIECFIYLEDATFVSEKSLVSTTGPIEFASRQAQMVGRGMELIYNDELNRLEFFRIIHLNHLRWKGSEATLFTAASGDGTHLARPTEALAGSAHDNSPDVGANDTREKQPPLQHYRCVLSRNVVIDTPERLIFAEDEISITDILWSTASDNVSAGFETDNRVADSVVPVSDATGKVSDEIKDAPVADQSEPVGPADDPTVIAITCDGGVVVTPMDLPGVSEGSPEDAVAASVVELRNHKVFEDAVERARLVARRVDYNASSGDAIAGGPAEFSFYVDTNDSNSTKADKTLLPARVSAEKWVKFSAVLNQVIFEGDCVGTVVDADPNLEQRHTLLAPKLTIDLPDNEEGAPSKSRGGIKRLTAHGGVVELEIAKTAVEPESVEGASSDGALLGLVELKCHRIEYDPGQRVGVATGPGIITLDNSKSQAPETERQALSIGQPCYAFLRNFETLKFFLGANKIVADAGVQETLWVDYIPIIEGGYGPQVEAAANRVEVNLTQSDKGQTELSTLTALGDIKYEDESYQFLGGELFYDQDESIIEIRSGESQPCYFNGALVDGVEYNLKTGERKALIAGPSTLDLDG